MSSELCKSLGRPCYGVLNFALCVCAPLGRGGRHKALQLVRLRGGPEIVKTQKMIMAGKRQKNSGECSEGRKYRFWIFMDAVFGVIRLGEKHGTRHGTLKKQQACAIYQGGRS